MSKANNLTDFCSDIATAIKQHTGVNETLNAQNFGTRIASANKPMIMEPTATTIRKSASQTENIVSNDNIRFFGSDNKEYTLAEWNALFVAAGYNKAAMGITATGLIIDVAGIKSGVMFDRPTVSQWYDTCGNALIAAGYLQHSIYAYDQKTAAGSGTDTATGKAWTITADGDELVLYTANTKQSFRMKKNCGNVYSYRAFNVGDRTDAMWKQNEWLRHRFAKATTIATAAENGTIHEVEVRTVDGEMYFFVKNDNNEFVDTGMLAKYNLSDKLTQPIANAIYAAQKTKGVNMCDTGTEKHIITEGAKGAEAIAVDGYWHIITPYISNQNATTTTTTNNMADSPAVYWAKAKGFYLASEATLQALWVNWTIANAMRNYLLNVEGYTSAQVPAFPTGDYTWCATRYYSNLAWVVFLSVGPVTHRYTYGRYCVVGAPAL